MGIGTVTLSSISRPFATVLRWLPLSRRDAQPAIVIATSAGELQGDSLPARCAGDASSVVVPLRSQAALSSAPNSALHSPAQNALHKAALAHLPLQKGQTADLFAETIEDSAPSCPTSLRKPLRIVHSRNGGDKDKLVISGRMADVCAELDRLAANEAAVAYG